MRNLITSSQFTTIQAAYNTAVSGNTVQAQMQVFPEDLNFNLNKSVTIIGGYDCDYLGNAGVTTVNGSMTVSDGMVTIENFILQ